MSPRSREDAKKATREKLIEAGIACFGEEGPDASLDAICERAGFTRGAFYVHFADRDDFLRAVMEKVGAQFLDAVLGTTADDADLHTVAARFLAAVAVGDYPLMREGGVKPHQLLDACARSRPIRERYVALATDSVARLARAVKRGQQGHALRDDVDAQAIATLLLAVIIGAQTMHELKVPLDVVRQGAALLQLLAPPPTGALRSKKRTR